MKTRNSLTGIIKNLPVNPGVYLMKDEDGEIIYIGKAGSLKKRVSSYFQNKSQDIKTSVLVKHIYDLEFIITDSEIEALLLENTLIKKYKPKFNIRLKDDKRYPYIAITLNEDYPRIIYTRTIAIDGYRYFGPYTDAKAAKNIISMINSIFKLKFCRKDIPLRNNERPCLNHQIHKCTGVCTGKISAQEYRHIVENVISFLEGNISPVIKNIQKLMEDYARNMAYEKASHMRDIIFDIQKTQASQNVLLPVNSDQDFISSSLFGAEAIVILFEFRGGTLLGRKIKIFENTEYSSQEDVIKSFIVDYYKTSKAPSDIITNVNMKDRQIIEDYLAAQSERTVNIKNPRTPEDRAIINMIQKNIDVIAAEKKAATINSNNESGLLELQNVLQLDDIPETIECFDISNFQGKDSVASMVSFSNGKPNKSNYRRYKIRGYDSPNDPAMIHEAVSRRIQFLINENHPLPDLIVIDGGITQLGRALEAAATFDFRVPFISIAKRFEEIYFDPRKPPLRLDKSSPALKIIQNIRDEAHRFAISYHRSLRDKKTTHSELDAIPGISAEYKKKLIVHFKSIDSIKQASIEDLQRIDGIGPQIARKVYAFFH